MKAIVTILGVVLLIVAAMFSCRRITADIFPGHETGLMRIRAKHGNAGRWSRCRSARGELVSRAEIIGRRRVHRTNMVR
jgi:hypothetical protein